MDICEAPPLPSNNSNNTTSKQAQPQDEVITAPPPQEQNEVKPSESKAVANDQNQTTPPPPTQLPHQPPSTLQPPDEMFRSYLNQRDASGRTALFIAVEGDKPRTAATLLDPSIPNQDGITPLHYACQLGLQTCIRVLIQYPAVCTLDDGVGAEGGVGDGGLVGLVWDSIDFLDERAEIIALLLANGAEAQCSRTHLSKLIRKLLLEYHDPFEEAVEDVLAQLILKKGEKKEGPCPNHVS